MILERVRVKDVTTTTTRRHTAVQRQKQVRTAVSTSSLPLRSEAPSPAAPAPASASHMAPALARGDLFPPLMPMNLQHATRLIRLVDDTLLYSKQTSQTLHQQPWPLLATFPLVSSPEPMCSSSSSTVSSSNLAACSKAGEKKIQTRAMLDPPRWRGVSTTESGFDMDYGLTLKPLSQCTGRSQGQWVCHPGLQLHRVRNR